jgi:hypothetical protein
MLVTLTFSFDLSSDVFMLFNISLVFVFALLGMGLTDNLVVLINYIYIVLTLLFRPKLNVNVIK